uniref:Uncharacterized protein n=2 Tax=Tanacetum cinerariifolium TaxID=118510 RepID=A0A699KBG6_TANCI|nr:hypothetical protein [Tanacetum cinerariifolium]
MHQPWRSFAATINKCLSGKTTGHDSLCLSCAQIIWGMYHNKNVDYVYLLWEDLVYQVENKNSKKNNDICYPRFTKFIIDYIMKKDLSIPRRNKSEKTPRSKYVQKIADSKTSPKKKPIQAPKGKQIKATAKVPKSGKKKLHAQGLETLSISWKSSDDEDDDDADNQGDNAQDDDNEHTESHNDGDDFVHPKLSTFDEKKDIMKSRMKKKEEKLDDDKTNKEEEVDKLYSDVNINLEGRDTKMMDASLANV